MISAWLARRGPARGSLTSRDHDSTTQPNRQTASNNQEGKLPTFPRMPGSTIQNTERRKKT
jgi:hypothetical protein